MPTPRFGERRALLPLALLAAVAALVLTSGAGRRSGQPSVAAGTQAWQGVAGAPRPRVDLGRQAIVLLKEPSLAQRVASAGGSATAAREREWTASVLVGQRVLLARLRALGIAIEPTFSFARVIDGFSAPIDARAAAALERSPGVRGVYPVRAAFPADLSSAPVSWSRLSPLAGQAAALSLPGRDGSGVMIALLDTAVDRTQPYLHGRVLPGYDLVDPHGELRAGRASPLEAHGTEEAGILVGSGGPGGLSGVAPGATVLPIRIAGVRRDALGRPGVYGRSDELIAGLERAVDPNADGDTHDAARVTLVGVAEPYASFADSPESRAVAGALALRTLVVAPAGNDGPGGPAFGTIAGPAGAQAALSVGAADLRSRIGSVRVVAQDGLDVVLNRRLPTGQVVIGHQRLDLSVSVPRPGSQGVPLLADFFGGGYSLVAGKAALVPASGDPVDAVRRAAAAGAAAVLLYGAEPASSAIGPDDAAPIPVVGIPKAAADALLRALRSGRVPQVTLGAARSTANGGSGRVAAFSSQGLSFAGAAKPDLAGPGVGIATAEPGEASDGSARYRAVTGTSAAAAVVAGAAAVLMEARPGLSAAELRDLLVGTATGLPGPARAGGAGLVDLPAAARAVVAFEPAAAGYAGRGEVRAITLRNLAGRRVSATLALSGPASVQPRRVALPPHGAARLQVGLRGLDASIVATVPGSPPVRIPLLATGTLPAGALVGKPVPDEVELNGNGVEEPTFAVTVGRVGVTAAGSQLVPARRLDLVLRSASGRSLGLLTRVRDLLPGRYVFAVSGRDGRGRPLQPGRYRIDLVAYPTLGGAPSRQTVKFSVQ